MKRGRGDPWSAVRATPAFAKALQERREAEDAKKSPAPPVVVVSAAPAMNKTEERYRQVLLGQGWAPRFGAVTLCLTSGAKRIRYTPDFLTADGGGGMVLHEVKGGHVWEDARIKFAVAVEQWGGMFGFVWAQWSGGKWLVRQYPRR